MSAIFNGSTAALTLGSDVMSGITLVAAWVKPDNLTSQNVVFCVSDSTDSTIRKLILECSGHIGGDAYRVLSRDSSSFAVATTSGSYQQDVWEIVFGLHVADNDRRAKRGSGDWASNTANHSITPNASTIGAANLSGGLAGLFGGRIAEVAVWTHLTSADDAVNDIVPDLLNNLRATNAQHAGNLSQYQPLRNGLDDVGFVGATWSNTDVTFDGTDHPIDYFLPWVWL